MLISGSDLYPQVLNIGGSNVLGEFIPFMLLFPAAIGRSVQSIRSEMLKCGIGGLNPGRFAVPLPMAAHAGCCWMSQPRRWMFLCRRKS